MPEISFQVLGWEAYYESSREFVVSAGSELTFFGPVSFGEEHDNGLA